MTIDEMIAVLQAAKEGKQIQARSKHYPDGGWRDTDISSWHFFPFDYRVKPEPREFWINVYPDHIDCIAHRIRERAIASCAPDAKTIRVREVIE